MGIDCECGHSGEFDYPNLRGFNILRQALENNGKYLIECKSCNLRFEVEL